MELNIEGHIGLDNSNEVMYSVNNNIYRYDT